MEYIFVLLTPNLEYEHCCHTAVSVCVYTEMTMFYSVFCCLDFIEVDSVLVCR